MGELVEASDGATPKKSGKRTQIAIAAALALAVAASGVFVISSSQQGATAGDASAVAEAQAKADQDAGAQAKAQEETPQEEEEEARPQPSGRGLIMGPTGRPMTNSMLFRGAVGLAVVGGLVAGSGLASEADAAPADKKEKKALQKTKKRQKKFFKKGAAAYEDELWEGATVTEFRSAEDAAAAVPSGGWISFGGRF
jgi:hypothetical protein